MTIRSLMVNLEVGISNDKLLTLVGDLAARFDARVVGIAGVPAYAECLQR